VERDGQAQGHRLLHRQFVMRSTEVLDKRVPGDDDPGTAVPLEPTYRSQSRLETAMIGLDVVVRVPLGTMPGRREQLVQHRPVRCRLVGHNFHRDDRRGADGLLEEALGGVRVATRGDEHVDDLPELVDRAVHVAPPASHLHVGLVDLPAVPDGMPAGPGGIGQQRREPLDPPVDGDVVNVEATLGEEFLDVAVRQRKAQVPTHCQHDHLGWEAEPSERGACDGWRVGTTGSHGDSLPAPGSVTAGATAPPPIMLVVTATMVAVWDSRCQLEATRPMLASTPWMSSW